MEIHVAAYMFLRTPRVYQVIYQHTARQSAKLSNSETWDNRFSCTAAFFLYSQPKQTSPKNYIEILEPHNDHYCY
jgi:hypothetical protein